MDIVEIVLDIARRDGLSRENAAVMIADELDRSYIKLPVCSDGEPIHIGDRLVFQPNGMEDKVRFLTYNGMWLINDRGWNSLFVRHAKPRTVEDVLHDFAARVLNSGHQWGLDAEKTVADYADEIREIAIEAMS